MPATLIVAYILLPLVKALAWVTLEQLRRLATAISGILINPLTPGFMVFIISPWLAALLTTEEEEESIILTRSGLFLFAAINKW